VDGVNAQLSEEAALTDRQERVRRWQIENKLTKADATQRYMLAREIGLDAGFDLERLSGEQFDDMLRGAVATLDGVVSAERQRRFKQQLVDSPGGGIHDGIEIFTATGQWVRPNAVRVDAKPLTPEQIERSARSNRRATAAEIRSAFLDRADDDEADGWKSLQRRAGDLFEAAAPKPQRGGSI
ncbi:MAG TPA: hypothetical protein VFM96_12535, partial [Gaiellaceae bacterium]|nr:hypothetical protein [Gaiellaceae bacterium]